MLKGADLATLTSLDALKCYLTFAQDQLAATAGNEVAGSMALHGLGKLYATLAAQNTTVVQGAEAKAVVYYQAALLACPQNYLSSNDLGVILGRSGHYAEARVALEHSVSVCRQAASWHNLAVVYRQLGCADRAARAEVLYAAAAKAEQMGSRRPRVVDWLDSRTFAESFAKTATAVEPLPLRGTPETARSDAARGISATQAAPNGAKSNQVTTLREYCRCGSLPILSRQHPRRPRPGPRRGAGLRHDFRGCPRGVGAASSRFGFVRRLALRRRSRGPSPIAAEARRIASWGAYAQGEYVAMARTAHVAEYRLRVDDQLDLIYRITRDINTRPYAFQVGDELRVESFVDADLNRDLLVLPDGTITLRLLGPVPAAGHTVTQLRDLIEDLYKKYYKVPSISIIPLKVNTKLEDLRATIDRQQGFGGQLETVRVTPEGSIALPAIGSVNVQGLTLRELQVELNKRFRAVVEGMEVIPVLSARAPRFVYVLGEVHAPGRFEMVGPTTLLQAISLAGSWNVGANLRQIVVFRRCEDWRLIGTQVNLQAALLGKDLPRPARSGSPTPTS